MPGSSPGPSSVIEDYVLTIYRMQVSGEPVIGARLAEQLHVAPASITEMLGRLLRDGLISARRPIRLSEEGMRMARTLVSRHRLVERFLVDVLGFGWDEVHEEAHRLEHALSAPVTERLADFLGHPSTCPHGHPIMEEGATEPDLHLRPLTTVTPGDTAVVRRIAYEEPRLLSLLTSLSIGLGTRVRVDAATSSGDGGQLRIEVEGAPRVIDTVDADAVLVER
jgi:DtxR family Mn-dependent transcriptional regulator